MEKTKSRRWIWIVLIVLAVVALLATCMLLLLLRARPLVNNTTVTPCQKTSSMVVDATKLNEYTFCAPNGASLTLAISNYTNACAITGGSLTQPKAVPAQSSFTLPAGQYYLNCGIPKINAFILVQ